jgi:hypothetical protein
MMSFACIHQIAKMTFIPPTTGFRSLTKSLHFALKRLHWVPHRFSDLQKQDQVLMPKGYWSCLSPWNIIRGSP